MSEAIVRRPESSGENSKVLDRVNAVESLSKAPYIRPQVSKVYCSKCNQYPNGFRSINELKRHTSRVHSSGPRKGFICIDTSPNKDFLFKCKTCKEGKVYAMDYNAAAHLRRVHFHPIRRGKQGQEDKKNRRMDEPAMEHLKQYWIKEVEITETDELASRDQQDVSEGEERSPV
ncbi:hypothetical protein BDV96DRAFT_573743 [Lophiotrema nucula]|uniref:DUF7896 domain-containing protein n=1 Tax=Lophiotrema nucula TaxID=690887 RepID=A0A6A5Z9T4_9PLEO|nr:hypothetical protein BDV96DRAFT_573743 [Lophiotrema nucula]